MNHPFFLISNNGSTLKMFRQSFVLLDQQMTVQPLTWFDNYSFFLINKWQWVLKLIHHQSSILLEQQRTLQPWMCSSIIHSSWSTNACASLNWSINHPFFLIRKWPCSLKRDSSIIHSSGSANDHATVIAICQLSILNDQQMKVRPITGRWIIHSSWSAIMVQLWRCFVNHSFFLISKWQCNR